VNSVALVFVLTLLLQWLTGIGVFGLMRLDFKRSVLLPAALILGMFLHTVGVFALELAQVRISTGSVFGVLAVLAVGANAWWPRVAPTYRRLAARPRWTLQMYDVAALVISMGLLYIVVWASYFWPVTPFDAMAGIDLVARQALIDGHINNQIFTDPSLRGLLSNQPYYAPFAMLMQIVYRSIGFTYGHIWLAVQCITFAWLMFAWLRSYVHPFIASVLWLALIITPEWYGYQFLLQTDMANAVFFTTGAWFFFEAVLRKDVRWLVASALFLSAAAWSRTETIIIIAFVLTASLPWTLRAFGNKRALIATASMGLAALASFGLWHWLYFGVYLPVAPNTTTELSGGLSLVRGFSVASEFLGGMLTNVWLWGHTVILFVVGTIVSLLVTRRLGNPLLFVWISCILVALIIVGTVFTAALVDTTLRRGIFKVLPLMILALAQSPLAQLLGDRLQRWELARAK